MRTSLVLGVGLSLLQFLILSPGESAETPCPETCTCTRIADGTIQVHCTDFRDPKTSGDPNNVTYAVHLDEDEDVDVHTHPGAILVDAENGELVNYLLDWAKRGDTLADNRPSLRIAVGDVTSLTATFLVSVSAKQAIPEHSFVYLLANYRIAGSENVIRHASAMEVDRHHQATPNQVSLQHTLNDLHPQSHVIVCLTVFLAGPPEQVSKKRCVDINTPLGVDVYAGHPENHDHSISMKIESGTIAGIFVIATLYVIFMMSDKIFCQRKKSNVEVYFV